MNNPQTVRKSIKKSPSVDKILSRLMEALKLRYYKEIAQFLGESEKTISAWRARDSRTAIEKILYRSRGRVDEDYLLAPDEDDVDVRTDANDGNNAATRTGVAATITSPRLTKRTEQFPADQEKTIFPTDPNGEDNQKLNDYLNKTARIITSKTIYRSALERNIDAFHKAVETEDEMRGIKKQLDVMELRHSADMDELKFMHARDMEELKILILGQATQQKREANGAS